MSAPEQVWYEGAATYKVGRKFFSIDLPGDTYEVADFIDADRSVGERGCIDLVLTAAVREALDEDWPAGGDVFIALEDYDALLEEAAGDAAMYEAGL